ncbi:MAG: MAPEG family protein [Pseudomonadales bacterium]|nr:MAPEG family protein [Pseudomonadales bacterium]
MLYPMFMMVMLTYVVMLITVRVRTSSVRKGEVPISYFSIFQGDNIPDMVHKTNRHFDNLFEMPVLFYVAGLLYIALDINQPFVINCAWAFVVSRIIHTCIHLGYNNILHRLLVFAIGNLCVLAMWVSIIMTASS